MGPPVVRDRESNLDSDLENPYYALMPSASRVRRSPSKAVEARARMYRDLLLDAAERVFGARGYHASRMEEVAAEAGVSLSTVYATFPSKRELFEALHETRGRQFL